MDLNHWIVIMSKLVASFNVNSIKVRLAIVLQFLKDNDIDFIALQELKCVTESFPYEAFHEAGYRALVHGQKAYNGVALIYKDSEEVIELDNPLKNFMDEARILAVEWHNSIMVGIYAPNGNPKTTEKFTKKMDFMNQLYDYMKILLAKQKPLIIMGDYNICPFDDDCYDIDLMKDDALLDTEARNSYFALLNLGLYDSFLEKNSPIYERYSYWDFQAGRFQKNQGVRIDHILANGLMLDKITKCYIDKAPRFLEKPSDHTPIIAEIS